MTIQERQMVKDISANDYQRIHEWMRANFIKVKCESESCTGESKVLQWALVKGKRYEMKRENFIVFCVKCHRKYDGFSDETRRKMSITRKGRPGTRRRKVMAIKNGKTELFSYVAEASRLTKTSRSAISNVLTGRAHTANGYVWKYVE